MKRDRHILQKLKDSEVFRVACLILIYIILLGGIIIYTQHALIKEKLAQTKVEYLEDRSFQIQDYRARIQELDELIKQNNAPKVNPGEISEQKTMDSEDSKIASIKESKTSDLLVSPEVIEEVSTDDAHNILFDSKAFFKGVEKAITP